MAERTEPYSLGDLIIAKQVKDYALAHYEEGYDALVEAWEWNELVDYIVEHKIVSLEAFLEAYQPIIDHCAEIRAEIF